MHSRDQLAGAFSGSAAVLEVCVQGCKDDKTCVRPRQSAQVQGRNTALNCVADALIKGQATFRSWMCRG